MNLISSKDRKVTAAVSKNGKQAAFSNTFGLANGKAFSCPGATDYCERICYAGKLENLFKGVGASMLHNWNVLSNAARAEMVVMLSALIDEFVIQAAKRNAPLVYRIHWDGDFFSDDYTTAWAEVIENHPSVQFWVYTRNGVSAITLHKANLSNLSLYFSADPSNVALAKALNRTYGIRIAAVAETFADSQGIVKDITGKPGAKCPEQTKQIPLISDNGGACYVCGLCVNGKANISFSRSKK